MNQASNTLRARAAFAGAFTLTALTLTLPASSQTTVGAQTRIDTGRGTAACNETTMAASRSNPLEIVGGWNDYREGSPRTGVALSLDGGVTWTDFLLRPAPAFQSFIEGDPMTAADDRTGTLWAGGMSFAGNGGIFVARKDPGSATFNAPVMARLSGGVDKGWMAAGRDPSDADATRVYIAYNEGLLISTDMGDNWTGPTSLGGGIGFLPKVGPNGELYIAYWDFGDRVELIRSFDGGATLSSPILIAQRMDVWGIDGSRFPGDYRVASLQGLAIDPNDGTLYVVYPDTTEVVSNGSNVDIYFTKSTDQGTTWTTPVVINGDAVVLPGDQFFPWIEVDQNGRIHMTFNDTRHNIQQDSAPQGLIDGYYSYSDDGGATWTEERLTAASFSSAADGFGGIFIGDYLGLATSGNRTTPIYMSTQNGDADVFTHVIVDGPTTSYCFGIQCPCGNDDPEAGCGNLGFDGSPDTGALMTASGTASIVADDLAFSVSGLPPSQFGIIYTGMGQANFPFGDGQRCIAPPFFRYAQGMSDPSGVLSLGPGEIISFANMSFGAAGMVVSGATWNYQAWYRDPLGPCATNFNLSNALSVTWF